MEMEVEHLGFILQVTRAMTVLPESLDFSTVAIAPDMVVFCGGMRKEMVIGFVSISLRHSFPAPSLSESSVAFQRRCKIQLLEGEEGATAFGTQELFYRKPFDFPTN